MMVPIRLVHFVFYIMPPTLRYIFDRDSAGPAGVFCVLHNALQQLRMDGEVDILATVRMIQTRRPEVITKLVNLRKLNSLLNIHVVLTFNRYSFSNTFYIVLENKIIIYLFILMFGLNILYKRSIILFLGGIQEML